MATNRPWSDPAREARAPRDVARYLDRSTGTRVTTRKAAPGGSWSHRADSGTSIHIVLTGTASENDPRGTVLLPRATLAVRPAAEASYEFRAGPSGARVVTVDFTDETLARLTPCDRALAVRATFKGRSSVEMAWRVLGELHAPDALTRATLRVLTDGIAIGCSRGILREHHVEPPPLAAAARRILDKEFRRPPSLGRLAKRVGCTAPHLARVFRSTYGFTVRGWIEARRVDEGKKRLSASDASIGTIAAELGFCDQAHFARAFRRVASVSPREFRNAVAGGDINPVLK
ncbi:MAG TPA: AraC family transcriptional regulator [Gemmatimonadaceae bacterium]